MFSQLFYLGCNTGCFTLALPAHAFTSHHVLQVWLSISQKIDKHLRLHGGEGNLDRSPGEIAGMVPGRRSLHLLLGLVHPFRRLGRVMSGFAADGNVQLGSGDQNEFNEKNPDPAAASHHGGGLSYEVLAQSNRKYWKAFNHF